MTAQDDRSFSFRIRAGKIKMIGRSVNLRVVLDHYAVLDDGNARRRDLLVAVEFCGRKEDIVRLPISSGRASVHEGRGLAVYRAASAVGIVVDFERVKNLDFIRSEKGHAVVSLIAPIALEIRGRTPFKVELERAKFLFGLKSSDGAFDSSVD